MHSSLAIDVCSDIPVIQLPSRLLMADVPPVRQQITKLIAQGQHRLVLDLGAVRALDSSGLSVLVTALKQVEQHAGEVVLARPNSDVLALLEMTRLQQVFAIFEDCSSAVRALH